MFTLLGSGNTYHTYVGSGFLFQQPANYDFAYEVSAPEYNVQFGHKESRQDMTARGSYSVLLPDGRTQIVEYEVDENGYRPTVTYREASGNGGYGQSGNGGYGQSGNGGYGQSGNGGYGQSGNGGYGGSQGGRGTNAYGGNGGYGGSGSGGFQPKGLSVGKGSYGQKNNGYGNGLSAGYQG